jgi:protein arginine kinase
MIMSWYHIPGNEQDVAMRTKVVLRRNLDGVPFPSRLDAAGARDLLGRAWELLEPNGFTRIDFSDISGTSAQALAEKGFITPLFARKSLPHALFLNDACNLAVMVCEEDHFCLQGIFPGLAVSDAADGALKLESSADSRLAFAFHPEWGYLTASPAGIGCGLEATVTLSLPLLAASGRMDGFTRQLSRMGLQLRKGFPDAAGFLFELSNRVTLGMTEEEVLGLVEDGARSLLEAERSIREAIAGEERELMTDRIRRAEGILRYARMVSVGEMTESLALLRLGAAMGLCEGIRVESLTALLCEAMPASLLLLSDPPPKSQVEQDIFRATLIRDRLFGV